MNRRSCLALLGFATLASCGYHVGGQADLIPKSIQTIAVPAFTSNSTQYRLADMLPKSISREFRQHSRFRVVDDRQDADAVLQGNILSVSAWPVVSDPTSGKATSVQMSVTLGVRLVERATGRVLFSRDRFSVSTQYESAVDPHQFFDESGPAVQRMSERLAQDIVSGIIEAF